MRRATRVLALALLLVPFASFAEALEPAPIRRVALVVGTNDGGHGRSQLRYAESDAATVHDVLSRLGGVSPQDGRLVLAPKLPQLVAELERLKGVLADSAGSKRVEFIFYYSGHSDEEGLLLGEERYGYRELRSRLDALPADVRIAILDSCASGAMTRRKGGTWKPPFMVDDSSKVKGHAILTSSADDESAQESDRLKASFFTHYLVSGLRGAADVTGDGRVTLNEAYQFAFNETLARTEATQNGAQHPAYDIQLSGTGDLVMTDLRGSNAGLRLAAEVDGRVFVRNDKGRLAAELSKFAGRTVDLGLDAGDYVVTVASDGQVYGARVRLVDGRRTDLARLQLVNVPKEIAMARGGRHVDVPAAPQTPEAAATPAPADPLIADDGKPSAPNPESLPLNPPGPIIDIPGVSVPSLPAPVQKVVDRIQKDLGTDPEDAGFERTVLHLGLVPGVGLPWTSKPTIATLSLGLVPSIDKVYGIGFGLGGNVVKRDLRGVAVGTGFNWVARDTHGATVATAFNVVGRDTSGFTGAAGFNVVGRSANGLLAAAGFNVVGGPEKTQEGDFLGRMELISIAAGFNVADGPIDGAQLSAGFNVAGGDVRGFQGAAGFNRAGDLKGVQLSIVNVAGDVTGVQAGLINVAGKVKGAQIGLINFNEDISGAPIGVLTVSKEGIFHPQVWGSTLGVNVGLKIGTRHVYSHASMGIDGGISYGNFGVGLRFPFGPFYLDVDAGAGAIALGAIRRFEVPQGISGTAFLGSVRATFGWQPFTHFGLFVGVGGHGIVTPAILSTVERIPSEFALQPDLLFGVSF